MITTEQIGKGMTRALTRARTATDNMIIRTQVAARAALSRPRTGAATAEYVVVVVAATAFAGVLIAIVKSENVKAKLSDLISKALTLQK